MTPQPKPNVPDPDHASGKEDLPDSGIQSDAEMERLLAQANRALIEYPRYGELHHVIKRCQRLSKMAGEAQC
ncbi:MAG: hypothetical protein M3328_16580, partial [Chloroflexota bacterium]|nr:hypothetical protein [Chloroflexota bacterium]